MSQNWINIAKREIRSSLRDRTFLWFAIIFYILILIAALGGYKNYSYTKQQREQAAKEFRRQWEEQHANPHSAAHFGTYLFKPFTFVGLYDIGLSNYTGNSYRVEAHKQHDVNYAPVRDRDASLRFGELTIASIFQVLAPLLIIFLCFSSISGEKENNTLKMLLIQGIKPGEFLWGKIAGNYFITLLLILPVYLILFAMLGLDRSQELPWPRLLAFATIYLLYFFIICGLGITVSAISKSSRSSLMSNLGLWIVLCVLLPRVFAGIADRSYKLPSRYDFNQNVLRGYTKGLDGDGSYVERDKKFRKQLLEQHRIDSVQKLPFNITGLAMQNGEDYNSKVYQHYFTQIEENIIRQQDLFDLFGFIDPVISVRQLSMGFSGTDYMHHIDFYKNARNYRDGLIRKLNMKHAAKNGNGSTDGEYNDFFRSLEDFSYKLPEFGWALKLHRASWLSLLFWGLMVCLLVRPVSKLIKPV